MRRDATATDRQTIHARGRKRARWSDTLREREGRIFDGSARPLLKIRVLSLAKFRQIQAKPARGDDSAPSQSDSRFRVAPTASVFSLAIKNNNNNKNTTRENGCRTEKKSAIGIYRYKRSTARDVAVALYVSRLQSVYNRRRAGVEHAREKSASPGTICERAERRLTSRRSSTRKQPPQPMPSPSRHSWPKVSRATVFVCFIFWEKERERARERDPLDWYIHADPCSAVQVLLRLQRWLRCKCKPPSLRERDM